MGNQKFLQIADISPVEFDLLCKRGVDVIADNRSDEDLEWELLFYMPYEHIISLLEKKGDLKWLLFTFQSHSRKLLPSKKYNVQKIAKVFSVNFLHKMKFVKLKFTKFRDFGDS